jgi:hypothetical protein
MHLGKKYTCFALIDIKTKDSEGFYECQMNLLSPCIPVHSLEQCIQTIIKVSQQPTQQESDVFYSLLNKDLELNERMKWLPMLSRITIPALDAHSCFLLQELSCFYNIANANVNELMELSFDEKNAKIIFKFFH